MLKPSFVQLMLSHVKRLRIRMARKVSWGILAIDTNPSEYFE